MVVPSVSCLGNAVAEWTERHADRHATDLGVHDLVPGHDLYRETANLAVEFERNDRFVRLQEAGVLDAEILGSIDRRDAIWRWSSADDVPGVDERVVE